MAAPSASSPDLVLPKTLGRYVIVRLIGEGAMGRVLLAHDPILGRDVALKLLRDDLKIPSDVREGLVIRMRHEAKAAARVMHPNIVTLHDLGEDSEVGLYLIFEYVEGPTLKTRLHDGPLQPKQVSRLARELGGALTCAHTAGVVHRDVKPENIILSMSGGKIADFGIARIPDSTLTHAGGLLGTPAYSAPETFRASRFSPESDQFSLAASLYEALTGRRAFPGDDAVAVAAKIATDTPERLAHYLGFSRSVDDVLLRAMDKEPTERFSSCEEFGKALASSMGATSDATATLDRTPSSPNGATPASSELPKGERKIGQVVIGGAVVVVTASLLLRTALRSADGGDEPTAPTASSPASAVVSAQRPPLLTAVPTHKPRPPKADSSAKPETDAGANPPAGASATAGAASTAEPSGGPSTDAGVPPSDGGH